MTRPAIKQGSIQTAAASQTILAFTATADVTWRCTVVAMWQQTTSANDALNSAFAAVVKLQVQAADVFEARLVRAFWDSGVLVIPWGTGIRMPEGQRVAWIVDTTGGTFWFSASFFGVYD
jgi:hypothetical protein